MSATSKTTEDFEVGAVAHVTFRVRCEKLGHGEEVFLVPTRDPSSTAKVRLERFPRFERLKGRKGLEDSFSFLVSIFWYSRVFRKQVGALESKRTGWNDSSDLLSWSSQSLLIVRIPKLWKLFQILVFSRISISPFHFLYFLTSRL
jgi:hypothetical protein